MTDELRQRATALVVRDGKVLLVRDKGRHHYSLPGGKIEEGETAVQAAARELQEELGMNALQVRRLPSADYQGTANEHHVSLITSVDAPRLINPELDSFTWWDMRGSLPMYAHVKGIIGKLGSGLTAGYKKEEGKMHKMKFGKLSYDFYQRFTSKEDALKKANQIRADGHLAHVVYVNDNNFDLYRYKGKGKYNARDVERQILRQAGYKNNGEGGHAMLTLKWNMFAGGTGAAEGKHSYQAKVDEGEYDIQPVSNEHGRHLGYRLHFVNSKGKLPGGLWQDLGLLRSPGAAKSKAKEHYGGVKRVLGTFAQIAKESRDVPLSDYTPGELAELKAKGIIGKVTEGYKGNSDKEGSMKYINSYAAAEAMGIKPCDSIISTVIDETKTPPLIVAFERGHTFSGKDINKGLFHQAPMKEFQTSGMTFYATDAKALKPLLEAKLRKVPKHVTLIEHKTSKIRISTKPAGKEKVSAGYKPRRPRASAVVPKFPTLLKTGGQKVRMHRRTVLPRA